MELSKRLRAVADLVTPGLKLADVGTDHAYVPVYLALKGIVPSAVAMDVNPGPLLRAKGNVEKYGLSERIELKLSDGLSALVPGEAQSVVIAGMGGALLIRIISQDIEKARSMKELILQPQSEIFKVRRYLAEEGFSIDREDMVFEDRKYYPMMRVSHTGKAQVLSQPEMYYGPLLLSRGHPVLRDYLAKEKNVKEKILSSLEQSGSERTQQRKETVQEDLRRICMALEIMKDGCSRSGQIPGCAEGRDYDQTGN